MKTQLAILILFFTFNSTKQIDCFGFASSISFIKANNSTIDHNSTIKINKTEETDKSNDKTKNFLMKRKNMTSDEKKNSTMDTRKTKINL